MSSARGRAKKRLLLKPRQPYMELAVSLRACWRMLSCCRWVGSWTPAMARLTCCLRLTRFWMTVGRGAMLEAGSGSGGRAPSSGRCTVVKQMLYSWMMEGYSELKSSRMTILSYRPFLGSRTRPPAYWGPLLLFLPPLSPLLLPLPGLPSSSSSSMAMPSSSSSPPPILARASLSLAVSLSGRMNLRAWNSWSSSISMRCALCPCSALPHKLPDRLVSCLVRGSTERWNISPRASQASLSALRMRETRPAALS
mmetsp:Transcript_31878/g.70834  ORF Transcript_31878/g.70834 Transcript_31878/m.70834 type:complete len:253 (+) Transcript_31878:669-1427(+)